MSTSDTVTESDSNTLVKERNRYDSLCTDEFEIVTDDILESEKQMCGEAASQWSISHSINVEPMFPLNSLTPLLTSSTEDKTIINGSPFPTISHEEQIAIRSDEETAVLNNVSLSPEATIETVLRSQNETRKILEATLASFETLSTEKLENVNKAERITELEGEVNRLKGTNKQLMEQLEDKKFEMDACTRSMANISLELEEAYRKISELSKAGTMNSGITNSASVPSDRNDGDEDLRTQIDVIYAKMLDEKERRKLAEEQLSGLQNDHGSFSMINERMVVKQLQDLTNYTENVESELNRARIELANAKKTLEEKILELDTKEEIIKVLKEEHLEGTRIIVERDQKITELEQIMIGLERVEVNNC